MDLDHVRALVRGSRRGGGGELQWRQTVLWGACVAERDHASVLVANDATDSTKCRAARRKAPTRAASLFLVAHELPVRRTPSTKAAWADLTLVLVRSMNLGRSHFDELRVAFLTERAGGLPPADGSMRANGIRVYTPTGMVRALMRVGRSRSAIPALTNFGDLVDAVRLMGVDAVAGGRRHNVQCG